MNRCCFCEPNMTVNPCSFVIPTFFIGHIATNSNGIIPSIVEVLGNIVGERIISTGFVAQIVPVDPNARIAVNAFERNTYPLS